MNAQTASANFKAAHATAKTHRANFTTYRAAFVAALKAVYAKELKSTTAFYFWCENQKNIAIQNADKQVAVRIEKEKLPLSQYYYAYYTDSYMKPVGFAAETLLSRAINDEKHFAGINTLQNEGKLYN